MIGKKQNQEKEFKKDYIAEHVTFKVKYIPDTYLELQALSIQNERQSRTGPTAHHLLPHKTLEPLGHVNPSDKNAKEKLEKAMLYVPEYFVYRGSGTVYVLEPNMNFYNFYLNTPNRVYLDDYMKLLNELNKAEKEK